jgi:hypothetical protein
MSKGQDGCMQLWFLIKLKCMHKRLLMPRSAAEGAKEFLYAGCFVEDSS